MSSASAEFWERIFVSKIGSENGTAFPFPGFSPFNVL
jgi:hypothetical protein